MNGLLKWSILGLFVVALLAAVLLGSGRLYGLLKSRQIDGQIAKIHLVEPDAEGLVETYLIKLYGNEGEVYVFASSDERWLMVKRKEWVRVRLYPAPPWSGRRGQWQNASLVAKLIAPKPEIVETPKSAPAKSALSKPATTKPKPVVPKQKTQEKTTQAAKDAKDVQKVSSKRPNSQTAREYNRKRPRGNWRRR